MYNFIAKNFSLLLILLSIGFTQPCYSFGLESDILLPDEIQFKDLESISNNSTLIEESMEAASNRVYNYLIPRTSYKINEIGLTYEARQYSSVAYVFFNQTYPSNVFYELRAYGAYNYQSSKQEALIPETGGTLTTNPPGYGFVGLLGYNFLISNMFSLSPFIRLDYYRDVSLVYRDTNGNAIDSKTTVEYIALQSKFAFNQKFGIFATYFLGYRQTAFYGSGSILGNGASPADNFLVSEEELGFNYRIGTDMSISPFVKYKTYFGSPNAGAQAEPYNLSNTATSTYEYSLRFGYYF